MAYNGPFPQPVKAGGTGDATFATYELLAGGTTATGPLQQVSGTGTSGQILTSQGAGALPAWSNGASTLSITTVDFAMSPYTVLASDEFLAVNTTGGVVVLNFPNTTVTGRVIHVKDSVGNATTNQISVTTPGGTVTFDGLTTYPVNVNYQAIDVIFDSANYQVF